MHRRRARNARPDQRKEVLECPAPASRAGSSRPDRCQTWYRAPTKGFAGGLPRAHWQISRSLERATPSVTGLPKFVPPTPGNLLGSTAVRAHGALVCCLASRRGPRQSRSADWLRQPVTGPDSRSSSGPLSEFVRPAWEAMLWIADHRKARIVSAPQG